MKENEAHKERKTKTHMVENCWIVCFTAYCCEASTEGATVDESGSVRSIVALFLCSLSLGLRKVFKKSKFGPVRKEKHY